jgi:anti-sigma B factor antagonist
MAMTAPAFAVISEEADRVRLRIHGELDLDSCPTILPAIVAAVSTSDSVVLDLSQVSFCDSQGLRLFVDAVEVAAEHGTQFAISGATPFVRRLFTISGVDAEITLLD